MGSEMCIRDSGNCANIPHICVLCSRANNPTWRTQLMLRTRHAMLPEQGVCPVCQKRELDAFGHHALACAWEFGTTRRHTAMVNMFRHKVFRLAGLTTVSEPPNLLQGSDDRPGDIYHEVTDPHGIPTLRTAYDVTIRSAYTQQSLSSPVAVAGQAATRGDCLLYTSPSPRDGLLSRMPSSA